MNWRCGYVYFAQKIQWVVENVLLLQGNWCIQSQLVWKKLHWKSCSQNISLAVIDINNLKRVNDSNGHFAGDELIKKVNDKLSQYATVVRWGGDEFFALLMQKRNRSLKTFVSHKKSLPMHTNLTLTKLTLEMLPNN